MRLIWIFLIATLIMEQKIDTPDENYDFNNMSLGTPISVYGGSYFTKLTNRGVDVFLQTPVCGSKAGVIKSGKRMFIDLLFDKTDENIVIWFERLEETVRDLIFEKRDNWFQETTDMDDIEGAFSQSVRLYKSGRYYMIRVFLDNPRLYGGSKTISIYDDRENELSIEDITSETRLICILQIHGVKFTSKSFQIYSQIKQAMVLKNNMFNNCCIKTNASPELPVSPTHRMVRDSNMDDNYILPNSVVTSGVTPVVTSVVPYVGVGVGVEKNGPHASDVDQIGSLNVSSPSVTRVGLVNTDICVPKIIELDVKDLTDEICENKTDRGLTEFNIELDVDKMESITLRNPNDVYYDIYKKARLKAKESRKSALQSYLEAQNIRNEHGLDIMDESSDDDYESQLYGDNSVQNTSGK
jgi:hypothetical protein